MYFKSAELKNFRNYPSQSLEFHKNLNLFLGSNAQGKTNLLESLFIMSLGKSFRTNNDQDMIMFGEDYGKASAVVVNDDEDDETEIEVIYAKEGKQLKVNGVKLQRSIELLENVYIVVFFPDDLRIIKDGPDSRRRFLDRELCQIKPVYFSDLGNYKKILKQRNFILKERERDMDLLSVFNESLANYGVRIAGERRNFTERLNTISRDIHSRISCGREELNICYESSVTDKDHYLRTLNKNFDSDVYRGYTGFGPHKDDLRIEVNGMDIRQFGSQGQQRTAALSLKLAEITLIKQETGCNAVLLLDDVLSELDKERQRFLIESMKDVQMFITATEIEEDLMKMLPEGYVFDVISGTAGIS